MIDQLKKLAELQGKATGGPWAAFKFSWGTGVTSNDFDVANCDRGTHIDPVIQKRFDDEAKANSELIAASRNIDLPALVAYVDELQETNKSMREELILQHTNQARTFLGKDMYHWKMVLQALKQEG